MEANSFKHLAELKRTFRSADYVKPNTVFNKPMTSGGCGKNWAWSAPDPEVVSGWVDLCLQFHELVHQGRGQRVFEFLEPPQEV